MNRYVHRILPYVCYTFSFFFFGVEYISAADGVADEREETERQAKHQRRQHGVAEPHVGQSGAGLVEPSVQAHWPMIASVCLQLFEKCMTMDARTK